MTQTKAEWLRSEIEKLEGMKKSNYKHIPEPEDHYSDNPSANYEHGHNQALTSIITRYKEELKVMESK